jgi:hypothetical protein
MAPLSPELKAVRLMRSKTEWLSAPQLLNRSLPGRAGPPNTRQIVRKHGLSPAASVRMQQRKAQQFSEPLDCDKSGMEFDDKSQSNGARGDSPVWRCLR